MPCQPPSRPPIGSGVLKGGHRIRNECAGLSGVFEFGKLATKGSIGPYVSILKRFLDTYVLLIEVGRPSKPKTELAQRLVTIRGDQTRAEFCAQLGVSDATYANYERGNRYPDAELLTKLTTDCGIDLHWLLTGEGSPTRSDTKIEIREQLPAINAIDPDLLKQIARIVSRAHAEAEIRLPADAQATELANAYNLLMGKAEDPGDTLELKSLLPWLETHLTKTLKQAIKEPGAGKREA